PVAVTLSGTGNPGGSPSVTRCSTEDGIARWSAKARSNQTTPTVDGGSTVDAESGLASSDVAPVSASTRTIATAVPRAASRTSTAVTVTVSGTVFVSSSS